MWNNSLRELWNIAPTGRNVKWNKSPNAPRRISHAERISRTQCISQIPQGIYFVEKSTHCLGRQMCAFFWWGMVDSDHRSQWQQIYSLPPLAAREIPHMELVNGVEPSTCWLQISCSAIEPHQHSSWIRLVFTRLIHYINRRLASQRGILYHIDFYLSTLFTKYF